MDIDSGVIGALVASSAGGSGSMLILAGDHVSAGRVNTLSSDGAGGGNHAVSAGGLVALPVLGSAAGNVDLSGLAAALAGPAVSAESLQRAREIAERRLRGVRRLMEENLREDLELQARFLPFSF